MKQYRFKTEEEFIRDGLWNDKYNCPYKWNEYHKMNKFLGEDIHPKHNVKIESNESFKHEIGKLYTVIFFHYLSM